MSSPTYGSDPVYTPEEQRRRLSDLQKAYGQINTGGVDSFFNDAAANIPNALLQNAVTLPLGGLKGPILGLLNSPYSNIISGALGSRGNKPKSTKLGPEYLSPTQDDPAYEAQLNAGKNTEQDLIEARQKLLLSFLQNTADTSGYNAVLGDIASQRKQAAKRYQTYSAQISDLFGNLGRKSSTYAQEQAGIASSSAVTRAQLAAQNAQRAQATRDTDAARLKAATEARAALGLDEAASAGAAGDLATQEAEQFLTDQAALGQTTVDTILANEALAKLMSSRQAAGFDLAGQQAQQQLNMSYEDLLASLAGAEAQTKMQRSQAISAGAPTVSEQLAILNADENYRQALANEGNVDTPEAAVTVWKKANPNASAAADRLLATFIPWVTTQAPDTIGETGKAPNLIQLVNAYSKLHPQGAKILQSDPTLLSLLSTYTGLK